MSNGLKIISGSSNPSLAEDVCNYISHEYNKQVKLVDILTSTFSDGESRVEINENVRGYDVFVVQSLSSPTNHHLVELCLILDALKRGHANSITVVLPYYGYARQDRKTQSRVPISAKVVADILQSVGVDRVVTIDLHAGQIQGFFDVPVDNLYASKILLKHIADLSEKEDVCIVSPDKGGVERASEYAKELNCGLAFCYKHRNNPNEISEMRLIGDVENKICVLVDDMIDTAGTLCKASEILKENNSRSIMVYSTHGVFSNDAITKLTNSPIKTVNITNTIPLPEKVLINNKFNVISVDSLLAKAINSIHENNSVSELFI